MPILANRPTPNTSGSRNFWKPSVTNTNAIASRTKNTALGGLGASSFWVEFRSFLIRCKRLKIIADSVGSRNDSPVPLRAPRLHFCGAHRRGFFPAARALEEVVRAAGLRAADRWVARLGGADLLVA